MKRFLAIFALLLTSVALAQKESAAQQNSIRPGYNLVVENIPPVPAAIAEKAAQHGEVRSAAFEDWDPSRREMLISTRFADVPQIHLVKMPAGARTQLTFFPDAVRQAVFNPKRGDYFLFSKDIGGGEFYQFYRYDVSSGDITLLTDGKSRNVGSVWAHEGDKIAYGSTRRDGNDVDIWVMDPAERKSDHMLEKLEGGGWQALDWSPDEKRLLISNEVSSEESYLWMVDANSGEKTLLTPKGAANVHYGEALFSRDGKGIYVATDKDSEFHRLAYIDLASKQHTYLTSNIPWDVDEFDLSDNGKLLAFVSNEDGFGVLHVLDTATRKKNPCLACRRALFLASRGTRTTATWDSMSPRHDPVLTFT